VLTPMPQQTLPPPPELSRGVRGVLVGSVVSSKCLLPHCVSLSTFWHRLISSSLVGTGCGSLVLLAERAELPQPLYL
jgi:hypothetical protein